MLGLMLYLLIIGKQGKTRKSDMAGKMILTHKGRFLPVQTWKLNFDWFN